MGARSGRGRTCIVAKCACVFEHDSLNCLMMFDTCARRDGRHVDGMRHVDKLLIGREAPNRKEEKRVARAFSNRWTSECAVRTAFEMTRNVARSKRTT